MKRSTIQSKIAECAALTEINNHTEAYILGCKILLDTNPVLEINIERLETIKARSDRRGYLSPGDNQKRHTLYQDMMNCAKFTFSNEPELLQQFNQSF